MFVSNHYGAVGGGDCGCLMVGCLMFLILIAVIMFFCFGIFALVLT
jgi:hypothetical protein